MVPDPADPTRSILVDAQRTKGLELELQREPDARPGAWSVAMRTRTARSRDRSRPPRRPARRWRSCLKHSLSLWNKYQFTPRIAAALGIISRGDVFTSTDNLVVLPAWARVDGAVFYDV